MNLLAGGTMNAMHLRVPIEPPCPVGPEPMARLALGVKSQKEKQWALRTIRSIGSIDQKQPIISLPPVIDTYVMCTDPTHRHQNSN